MEPSILPKNKRKQFELRYHGRKVDFFVRFLGKLKIPIKDILKLTDLYKCYESIQLHPKATLLYHGMKPVLTEMLVTRATSILSENRAVGDPLYLKDIQGLKLPNLKPFW